MMVARRIVSKTPVRFLRSDKVQTAESQQERHYEVIGDHRCQGDGLDDDHAGRGREAADEDEGASAGLSLS